MRKGAVLVTGGTGVTGSKVAAFLAEAGVNHLVASRHPDPSAPQQVRFDWSDESTWAAPFEKAEVTGVYLISPFLGNAVEVANRFIDFAVARTRGWEEKARFVLLNGSGSSPDDTESLVPMVGIHRYLHEQAGKGELEYASVNATWFMDNMSEANHPHVATIKEGVIYSGAGEGRVPFVAAEDIARTAFHLLIADSPVNDSVTVVGPELLSHSDVAAIISAAIGRQVEHKSLSKQAFIEHLTAIKMPPYVADMLADLDLKVAEGSEEKIFADAEKRAGVKRTTGQEPLSFKDFVQRNKDAWR